MAIKKKEKVEYGEVLLNKPKQIINMDVSGMTKFQFDMMDILLHKVQQTCDITGMIDNTYVVNILDAIKFISDNKDSKSILKENKRIEGLINSLTNLKLITHDMYSISNMVIFPYVYYNKSTGDIKYKLYKDIEMSFINKNKFIVDSVRESEIKNPPSAYYTRIYLSDTDKSKNCTVATKSLYQIICNNIFRFESNNINYINFTIDEFRASCGYNYKAKLDTIKTEDDNGKEIINYVKAIDYSEKSVSYSNMKDFKRHVINKIKDEMLDCYGLAIDFEIESFGKNIKNVCMLVDTDEENYKAISKRAKSSVENESPEKLTKKKSKKKGFENNVKGKEVITYTKSDIEENIVDEIILDCNGNEIYESWIIKTRDDELEELL